VVSSWTRDRARSALQKLSGARLDWPAFSQETAGQLQRSVGFDGWCFAQLDPATLLPAQGAVSNSPATASQRRFWQIEYQLPDVNKLAALARSGQPVRALSTSTGGDLARSRRWEEILRPAGGGDELRAVLQTGGQCWGSLTLYRASASRPYTSDDIQYLSQVLAEVAAGARGAWASRTAASPARPAEAPGTIIVTAGGQPLTATLQARRWLTRLGSDPAGRHSQALIYAITALLTAAASPANAAPEATVRTRTTDGQWLDIHASPLEAAPPGWAIAITIQPAAPSRISPLLMAAHTLSPRERQVASLILDGRTPVEIAQTLYISLYTAKDHIKEIFRKTGTHSRPELTQSRTGHL